jgi:hypothetical protein
MPKWMNVGLRLLIAAPLFLVILLMHALGLAVGGGSFFDGVPYFWRQLRSWVREPLVKYRVA